MIIYVTIEYQTRKYRGLWKMSFKQKTIKWLLQIVLKTLHLRRILRLYLLIAHPYQQIQYDKNN